MVNDRRIFKNYFSVVSFVVRSMDAVIVLLSGVLAYVLKFPFSELSMPVHYSVVIFLGSLLTLLIFPFFGVYYSWRGRSLFQLFGQLFLAWGVVLLSIVVLVFSVKMSERYSRLWFAEWAMLGLFSIVAIRIIVFQVMKIMRRKGWNHKKILIVGAGRLGRQVAGRLRSMSDIGLDVIGYLDDDSVLWGKRFHAAKVIGGIDEIALNVESKGVDEVWLALPLKAVERVKDVLYELRHNTVNIRFVPDISDFRLLNYSVTEVAGIPMLNISASPMTGINRIVKAIEDRVLATLILILISPLMLVLAIGVKISSPGPIFYRQERVGWNGKPFMMLKFRSMPVDAEKTTGPVWAKKNENRATPFGAFLRKTSLDELPQFINVLKGEMSIVGPRPERTIFVEKFKEEIPDYMKKHLVKAGITGWAQINGWRGSTDLGKRIEYDLYYIEHWSLWFDIKIIFLTLFKGFLNENAY